MEKRGGQKGGGKKRNKKQFYKQQFQATKKSEELQAGLTGFLITCDQNKEKRCVKEIFNVLNEWVEKLYPELDINEILSKSKKTEDGEDPTKRQKVDEENHEQKSVKEKTLDQEINDEIQGLRQQRIFFIFETGTSGVVFIKLLNEMKPYIDVKKLGMAIINHVHDTKESSTRFTCRFIPVDILCKAGKFEEFKKLAEPIIHKYFKQPKEEIVQEENGDNEEVKQSIEIQEQILQNELVENEIVPSTWCLEFKKRNNNSVSKKEFLDFLFRTINGKVHPVDMRNSDQDVIIDIFKDILVFTIVPKYKEFKKFNLQQLVKNGEDEEDISQRKVVKVCDLKPKFNNQQKEEIESDNENDVQSEKDDEQNNKQDSQSESEDGDAQLI